MRLRFIIMSFFILSLINVVNAAQVCQTYDDFSSGVLDTSKWEETSVTIDEHFVDVDTYHTAQLVPADKQIILEVQNTFFPGDIIEYDVDYISGSGNRIHRAVIDNLGYSLFGFWNSVSDGGVGNDFGLYHVKITFTEEGLSNEITLPNGSIVHTRPDGNLPSSGLSHTFSLETRTGHNGIVHIDYDNVIVCLEEPELPEPTLEERVVELELRVQELENRTTIIESFISQIVEFIESLPNGLKALWDLK